MMQSFKVTFLSFNYNDAISRPMRISTRLVYTYIFYVLYSLPFNTALSTAALLHRKPASATISYDSCSDQLSDKTDTTYVQYITIHKWRMNNGEDMSIKLNVKLVSIWKVVQNWILVYCGLLNPHLLCWKSNSSCCSLYSSVHDISNRNEHFLHNEPFFRNMIKMDLYTHACCKFECFQSCWWWIISIW